MKIEPMAKVNNNTSITDNYHLFTTHSVPGAGLSTWHVLNYSIFINPMS